MTETVENTLVIANGIERLKHENPALKARVEELEVALKECMGRIGVSDGRIDALDGLDRRAWDRGREALKGGTP